MELRLNQQLLKFDWRHSLFLPLSCHEIRYSQFLSYKLVSFRVQQLSKSGHAVPM